MRKTSVVFRLSILIFSCSFISLSATAQTNYQKAILVLNNGDRITGWVDYRNWKVNPEKISYKKDSLSSEFTSYGESDLQYFEVIGQDAYQRAIVSKDMRPVKEHELPDGTQEMNVTDTAFLRVLVKSDGLNLFELVDSKNHFFIQSDGGSFQELLYKVYKIGNYQFIKREIYKDQLKGLVNNRENRELLASKIHRINYNETDLRRIVLTIKNGVESKEYSTDPKKRRVQLFAAAGATFSNIKFKGSNTDLKYVDFKGSFQPSIAVGIDVFSNRDLQSCVLRFEIAYYTATYKGEGYREWNAAGFKEDVTYNIKQTTIAPALSLVYNFFNGTGTKIYGGVGATYNISAYPTNNYITYNSLSDFTKEQNDYLHYEKAWISGALRAGVILNSKIEITALADVIGDFTDFSNFSGKRTGYTIRAGYRL
jgi:hypothetical protein